MATPAKKATKTTKATTTAGGFDFDTGVAIPAATTAGTSENAAKLAAMPVGSSFLIPVAMNENIKDSAERLKIFKEATRTVMNRMSGAFRRFSKKNGAGHKFAARTVNDADLGQGVRVWRVEAPKA